MAEHKIKIKYSYYKAVLSGEKTFEIRKNDRNYCVGDIIHFVPIDDNCGLLIPHKANAYRITYVFHGGEYGIASEYCVFGIAPAEREARNIDIDVWIDKLSKIVSDPEAPGEYKDYCLHLIGEIEAEYRAQAEQEGEQWKD